MISPTIGGIVVAAFIAGAFIASPELRAYAANTVFSTDIVDGEVKSADLANNAVTAAKVKDGEIKAAEIAADSVGGSELQGVTKLLFGQCVLTSDEFSTLVAAGELLAVDCTISGVESDDSAVATMNGGLYCFEIQRAFSQSGHVKVILRNDCAFTTAVTNGKIGVIVFDK